MGTPWHEALRSLCENARELAGSSLPADVVLFYVARWCQKESGDAAPGLDAFDESCLAGIAARVVHNLGEDGARVDRLVAGDAGAWTELRRLLRASACLRVDAAAGEYADEALQKIAVVLLTGTAPSQAAARLAGALEGPANEYVFTSPFEFWARTVVINLIVDDKRRLAREREAPRVRSTPRPLCLDTVAVERAHEALPGLLDAVRELPPTQRSVMVWSLRRSDLDPIVTDRLRELAPDLFAGIGDGAVHSGDGGAVDSDLDIAERLGTTPRLVAANRSAARCKLAARDPHWKLLLDVLLPHRSTRPTREEDDHG